jgi:small GTP-binding protein
MASPGALQFRGKVVIVGDYCCGKTTLLHRHVHGTFHDSTEPTIAAAFQTQSVALSAAEAVPAVRLVGVHAEATVAKEVMAKTTEALQWPPVIPTPGAMAQRTNSSALVVSPELKQKLTATPASVKLELWDTAGSERYESLMPMYFRDAVCAIVVFDVTRRSSLQRVGHWARAYRQHNDAAATQRMKTFIVGTKGDLYGTSTGPGAAESPVTIAEMRDTAAELGYTLILTSALDNVNVDVCFRAVAVHVASVAAVDSDRQAAGAAAAAAAGRNGSRGRMLGLRSNGAMPASMTLRGPGTVGDGDALSPNSRAVIEMGDGDEEEENGTRRTRKRCCPT